MPRSTPPILDKERSPLQQPQSSQASSVPVPASRAEAPLLQPIQSTYSVPGAAPVIPQPTYSETILQRPILATDSSTLPAQQIAQEPSSATSRRRSSSSMRNASMTFENITPTATPTGRVSKAKKGKRVHACEFPGCGKVFTRAEHKRRHELNHNPDATYRCPQPGCGRSFHRVDLLQRHQERHESEASPNLALSTPRHSNTAFTSPPSVLPPNTMASPPTEPAPRTSAGGLSIGSLVNPHSHQYHTADASLPFDNMFVRTYSQTVDPYSFYGSEGSRSPASDRAGQFQRQSISSASSVAAFDPSSMSPTMTTMPGTWVPATAAPPMTLPSNVFEEGQAHYIPSPTVNPMPVHLRELDGHEFATIQRELSTVPGLIFDRSEIPRYIRFDCLEHYWKFFHPSFPIVYKPNFVTNTPPPLLLSAVLAIGSFYDSRPDAKLYSLAVQEIATKLLRQRGETITSRSRIADLQTVLLLEILSKYSARHATPETSARFRALYASLHQTRQILVQNPLAVFRTLREEKSEDDLKRAHKFWLEHEARRRIFHACSVLDAQQVALFDQRPTIVTHSNLPNKSAETRGGFDLPCDEVLWEASPLAEWSAKATNCVFRDVDTARTSYQAASVNDYSFFQHQIINLNASPSQRCLEELSSPPEQKRPPSKTRFNYHVFQMSRHVPVRSLLIVAGESWFLGRKIEQEAEYNQARHVVREWIARATSADPSVEVASSIRAHWHAIKLLRMVAGARESIQHFRTTNMLHEDWSIYLATLVCWAHAYARRISLQAAVTPAPMAVSKSSTSSRKRKASEIANAPRKRQATLQAPTRGIIAPSAAAHTTQNPFSESVAAYSNPAWSAYGPASNHNGQWAAYYDESMVTYSAQADVSTASATATDPSAYGSAARTAANTPQSQSSFATTAPPTSIPAVDDLMIELRIYLSLTEVAAPQYLVSLDSSILARVKFVLDAVRMHKIGAKRMVGGLMNDAERVLSRLAEGENNDMF